MRTERGLTFVELLLAMGLMAVIVFAAGQTLGVCARRSAQVAANAAPEERLALRVMGRDLRTAFLSAADETSVFVVRSDAGYGRLEFFRAASDGGEPEVTNLIYATRSAADGTRELWREEGGESAVLCRDVTAFRLAAYDGENWVKEWGWDPVEGKPSFGIRGLPLVVSVTLIAGGREATRAFPLFTPLLERALHG